MPYRSETDHPDYSDYASGKVFYGKGGQPTFPIRLAQDIFTRLLAFKKDESAHNLILYDPCCGSGYHLSVLAHLNWKKIGRIIVSDVDPDILEIAKRNLALLSREGIEQRAQEIRQSIERYGKASHQEAYAALKRLERKLLDPGNEPPISTKVFLSDVFDVNSLKRQLEGERIDLVITDIPYGQHSKWRSDPIDQDGQNPPVYSMLQTLWQVLPSACLVAVVSDKNQKIKHPDFQRLDQYNLGKRRVVILKPLTNGEEPNKV